MIDILRQKYLDYEETQQDEEIIEKCLMGYDENDFLWAVEKYFKYTKNRSIKKFRDKSFFIRYRNLEREILPNWVYDLSDEDQYNLKEAYKIIIGHCFREWDEYNFKHEDILELIYAYHKEAIPYWCIIAFIRENINTYKRAIYKNELIEFMNNGKRFKDGCREIFKKQQEFKKKGGLNLVLDSSLKS